MLPCLSKQLFNISCPGCGIQRSLLLVYNGHFVDAFKMYPAIYFLLALALLIIIKFLFNKDKLQKVINKLAILSVITILTNYIINLTLF